MRAIYWARIDAVYFANDLSETSKIGFDDAFQYEDFAKPYEERRIKITQLRQDLGAVAYKAWAEKPDKHPYQPDLQADEECRRQDSNLRHADYDSAALTS
jgi:guanine deaminase